MRNKIVGKFVGAFVLLIMLSVLILNFYVGLKLKGEYEEKISKRLSSNAFLVGDLLKEDIAAGKHDIIQKKVRELAGKLNVRVTIIDGSGTVLGDSDKDPGSMEDHENRPEVIRALKDGAGESTRYSDTVEYNMKYVAVAISHGRKQIGVVRLALPIQEVESQFRIIYKAVLTGGIIAILFTLISGYFISKSIINPISEMKEVAQAISEGDFNKRAKINSEDELGVLARSLNRMADEMQLKMNSLSSMDKMKTDFVANVSHELKTPLTTIKGFIETLENGAIDEKDNARRFLSIIKKNAERLSNITDDLLKLSELELGKDRIEKKRFDLKDLIKDVVLRYSHLITTNHFKVEQDYHGKSFMVNADMQKMEQVLVNILDNSMKYTGEGGSIKINAHDMHDHFMISVEDNGIGIPAEHLDRVFERFYRVDKARSRKLGGTGLGLSIVKHAVLLHGGDIRIESIENKGTKVAVTLPKAIQS